MYAEGCLPSVGNEFPSSTEKKSHVPSGISVVDRRYGVVALACIFRRGAAGSEPITYLARFLESNAQGRIATHAGGFDGYEFEG
jgi:hypothetical protein